VWRVTSLTWYPHPDSHHLHHLHIYKRGRRGTKVLLCNMENIMKGMNDWDEDWLPSCQHQESEGRFSSFVNSPPPLFLAGGGNWIWSAQTPVNEREAWESSKSIKIQVQVHVDVDGQWIKTLLFSNSISTNRNYGKRKGVRRLLMCFDWCPVKKGVLPLIYSMFLFTWSCMLLTILTSEIRFRKDLQSHLSNCSWSSSPVQSGTRYGS